MNATSKISVCVMAVCSLLWVASAQAHHSYAQYDRSTEFSITGAVMQVAWVSPHVILYIQTETSGVYTIVWRNAASLERAGVLKKNVEVGDNITLTGARNRDPAVLEMTLIKEITLPAKNWHWVSPSKR